MFRRRMSPRRCSCVKALDSSMLLVTSWSPDARYSGGMVRKVVERLPSDKVFWVALQRTTSACSQPWRQYCPPTLAINWRIQTGTAAFFWTEMQARWRARAIADHLGGFRPDVVWVVAELGAINVAWHLARRLRLPLHGTFYDAQECARATMPKTSYLYYERSLRRLVRKVESFDAISDELRSHLLAQRKGRDTPASLVFPPSVSHDCFGPPVAPDFGDGVKRIGVCGSMRSDRVQWERFVCLLGKLPCRVEIVAFVDRDQFHDVTLPANVVVNHQSFAATERDVIEAFQRGGFHACYLSLWRSTERRLFARTSLSSKLATYCAAGVPTIVDGPVDSVAWRLVREYGAGVLLEGDETGALPGETNTKRMQDVFGNPTVWSSMSQGAERLVRSEFDLEKNVERFTELLARYSSSSVFGLQSAVCSL